MLLDRFRMDGKVAVVTGAGRGIGRGCALAFAEAGAHIVCAARTAEQVEDTAAEAEKLGVESLPVLCDVSDPEQRQNLIDRAMERFGRIDALVNNAGGSPPRPALETSDAMFARAFDFNVTTAFSLTRLAVRHMLAGDGGSVVNISSAAGRLAQPGFAAYGTAKAALSALTRLLGQEFAPRVRVNAIAVGSVGTSALLPFLDDGTRGKMEELTPMGRLGTVEDIALGALFLGTPAASWVTGKIIEIDGGTESTNWPFDQPQP